jgi:hypothetical protein
MTPATANIAAAISTTAVAPAIRATLARVIIRYIATRARSACLFLLQQVYADHVSTSSNKENEYLPGAMKQPTQRTLICLRKTGALAKVVEKYNHYAKRRFDCFGADIMCIQGLKLIAIQTTSGDHHADHLTKALANPEVLAWLRTGNGFEVWSWKKKGPRGKRKLWTSRVTQLCLNDGDEVGVL